MPAKEKPPAAPIEAMSFEVRVITRGNPAGGESSADLLDEPVVATTARGVAVVPVSV